MRGLLSREAELKELRELKKAFATKTYEIATGMRGDIETVKAAYPRIEKMVENIQKEIIRLQRENKRKR